MILDALIDACLDTLKLLAFLFVTYLFMEWLEHGAGKRFESVIARAGRIGPLVGALLGMVPQCGFSGAAATLYAGRVVTLGTLFAVLLATSDEMLPLMVAQADQIQPQLIVAILATKVIVGMVCGLVVDFVLSKTGRLHAGLSSKSRHEGHEANDVHILCEEEGCQCVDNARPADSGEIATHANGHGHARHSHDHGDHVHDGHAGIVWPAIKHSLNVSLFVLIITLLLNLIVEVGLEDALASVTDVPYLSAVVMGLFGLIPNCAVSVAATQLYLDGLLQGGAFISGLCVNAGVGLLVLFRTNHDVRENLCISGLLIVLGIVAGCVVQALGLF